MNKYADFDENFNNLGLWYSPLCYKKGMIFYMKNNVFDFKSGESELQTKRINKKRIILLLLIILLAGIAISLLTLYSINEEFRDFWDYTVLRKEIESSEVKSIALEKDNLKFSHSYDKRIVILEKNTLKCYNQDANLETQFELNIANPLYHDCNRFLVVAEKSGKKIYLINENNMMWQKDLEGDISQIYVNKNGYVGVAMTTTGYKTIIVLYNPSGEELFRTYLPTTYCIDMEISNDNKYMAIAELNTSGTMIETFIKIISIESAKTKPQEAFIATYNANSNNMILNIKYTDSGKLIAMYDNGIFYASDNMEEILSVSSNTIFADIESTNKVVSIEKQNTSLLNINYVLKIYNTSSEKTLEYNLKEIPKELYVKDNTIVISYGTDVEIVSAQSGWLLKKYVSRQDIKNVLISSGFVAIEYSDQIKFIKI